MKVKVYAVVTDDVFSGTEVQLYGDEDQANSCAWDWCASRWDGDYFGRGMPEDWREAWFGTPDHEGLLDTEESWIVVCCREVEVFDQPELDLTGV